MSQVFGWVPIDGGGDLRDVAVGMAAALRVDEGQRIGVWTSPGVAIGVIEPPAMSDDADNRAPAVSADGRFLLWMAGEAYVSGDAALPLGNAAASRTPAFRRALLDRWLHAGVDVIQRLDGEYQIAVWDTRDRVLSLINDRFGGLMWYWAQSPSGFAFAGGVRGVLMAPGVRRDADLDALREAATFGGFRLADRTNVTSVRMVAGATVQTIRSGARTTSRYWTWTDVPAQPARDVRDLIPEVHARWQHAVARRMTDRARYGQTLSGGLDSRAILAEAAPGRSWTAITYGVPGCDDAALAARAAAAVGASWEFQPLYAGDWLADRSAHIQSTDGLIELGDLMHLESLPLQRARFDVNMSGYIGDAVSGPTYGAIASAEDALLAFPYYGASISLPYEAAIARVRALAGDLHIPPRFFMFEHKMPQSTNRWIAAWRPWLRVRKPFVDYAFFDLCQGLPGAIRVEGRLHERWLRARYPGCFASIPNQKTGMPVLTPRWRIQAARLRRGAWARLVTYLPPTVRPASRIRNYADNDRVWRQPGTVDAITSTILKPDGLAVCVFGREPLSALLALWVATAAAPAQVIGALYVFEMYHERLGKHLSDAKTRAASALGPQPSALSPGSVS
ncbi:MAG: asparagine synthase-related protein [Vicinamibacterales bacterium]